MPPKVDLDLDLDGRKKMNLAFLFLEMQKTQFVYLGLDLQHFFTCNKSQFGKIFITLLAFEDHLFSALNFTVIVQSVSL